MRILALAAAVVLSGCAMTYRQVNQMTPAQVAQLSDKQMCEADNRYNLAYNSSFLDPGPMNPAFAEERDRRVLSCVGDVAIGRGTAAIVASQQYEAYERARKEAASNAAIGLTLGVAGAALAQPARPAMLVPRAIDCQSTGNGRYISCY